MREAEEFLAIWSECAPPRRAIEQRQRQSPLERAYVMAHYGWGERQGASGGAERSELGDRGKHGKGPELVKHCSILSNTEAQYQLLVGLGSSMHPESIETIEGGLRTRRRPPRNGGDLMSITQEDARHIVLPFYTHALTVNTQTHSTAVLEKILADCFQSMSSQQVKSKTELIKQVEFFWKTIPDLKWEPQDIIIGGNKVVVRSIASGSPRENFMGLAVDGSRSFRIDTIDIHEVEGGQVIRVHHLEDWATAIKQLSAK